ncbi:hypothetical protein ANO11243_071240 [Dothideomycetidae sp. 11243]|nr:hypothetical protein ANO11243_071240 [fungal sp. No.11243]
MEFINRNLVSSSSSPPPWYRPDADLADVLPPETRQLLQEQTGLDDTALMAHIVEIRHKAWSYGQYPTIGGFRFLRPILCKHPFFPTLCSKLENGGSLLELGPGLGQDLEYLRARGAPSARMYAVDCRPELWELGRRLFNRSSKQEKEGPHFVPADLVGSKWAEKFLEAHGPVDMILANQFFDTISDEYSVSMLRWLRPLLKPGAVVVGYHIGADEPFESQGVFYHNRTSWWCSWQALRTSNWQPDMQMEVQMYEKVGLNEWGLQPSEWQWIADRVNHFGRVWVVRSQVIWSKVTTWKDSHMRGLYHGECAWNGH